MAAGCLKAVDNKNILWKNRESFNQNGFEPK